MLPHVLSTGFHVLIPLGWAQTRSVAQQHLIQLHGVRGKVALTQGWATRDELEQMAGALIAWGSPPRTRECAAKRIVVMLNIGERSNLVETVLPPKHEG